MSDVFTLDLIEGSIGKTAQSMRQAVGAGALHMCRANSGAEGNAPLAVEGPVMVLSQ
jgi:hypothetical protein